MNLKNEIGAWGEELASEYLRKQKFRIIFRNFRVRSGEIDIIAENNQFIVFAEVKTRKDDEHGAAREFVGYSKQRRIRTAAEIWISGHPSDKQPRFDVIEVYAPQGAETKFPRIVWIENAFECGGF